MEWKENDKIKKCCKDVVAEKTDEILEEKYEVGEDSTKYGEFISSYFAWISLPTQKKRAEELNNMTKGSNNNKK